MTDFDFSDQISWEIPHLQRYAYSLTGNADRAQDLVQDCCERALNNAHRFTPGTNLRAWLFTILRNLNIDEGRRKVRRGHHQSIDDVQSETSQPPRQEDYMALRELERRLAMLRRTDHDILMKSVFGNWSHEAIAQQQGIAVGTVKSRLSRARQSLAG